LLLRRPGPRTEGKGCHWLAGAPKRRPLVGCVPEQRALVKLLLNAQRKGMIAKHWQVSGTRRANSSSA
jgi:hypothetical protein